MPCKIGLIAPFSTNDCSPLVFKSMDPSTNMDSASAFLLYNQQQTAFANQHYSFFYSNAELNVNQPQASFPTYMLDSAPFYSNYPIINSTVGNLF